MAKRTAVTATRAGSSLRPDRRWTGRTTASSVTAASAMVATTAMATASHSSKPCSRTNQAADSPPTMAYGPMAKLKNPVPANTT